MAFVTLKLKPTHAYVEPYRCWDRSQASSHFWRLMGSPFDVWPTQPGQFAYGPYSQPPSLSLMTLYGNRSAVVREKHPCVQHSPWPITENDSGSHTGGLGGAGGSGGGAGGGLGGGGGGGLGGGGRGGSGGGGGLGGGGGEGGGGGLGCGGT